MKNTIVRKLLDHITFTLLMDTKTIFHINDEYFLKKEQKQKEKFALEFVKWCEELEYNIHFDTKEQIKYFVKDYDLWKNK
jgi:hypothetical protein